MRSDQLKDANLGFNRQDSLVAVAKSVFGTVPGIGSAVSEIVGYIIPNQRQERIVTFVQLLDDRVSNIEKRELGTKIRRPSNVDLLEDAFLQAARATSGERLEHIANVVANGLSADESKQAETKRMVWLLGQLTDQEIVLLRGSLPLAGGDYELDSEFQDLHEDLLGPDPLYNGASEEQFEVAELKSSYMQNLHELNLMRLRFKTTRRGEAPEFDEKTGMMKSSGSEPTLLGKMLLRYLDLMPDWYRY